MAKTYEYLFRLLVVGDSDVGKTSILLRFSEDEFNSTYLSTIGVDVKFRTVELEGKKIKLQLWDTASHERFRTIRTAFYRGTHGIIFVYDITNIKSFENIKKRIKNVDEYAEANVERIILGNNCHMEKSRQVRREQGERLAAEHAIKFMETSAKTGQGVEEAFLTLTRDIKAKMDQKADPNKTVAGSSEAVNVTAPRQVMNVLASLGPEGRQHYLEAIQKGTVKIARVNIDVLGDGEAGKSSLADSLMDEPFEKEKKSTIGANVIYMTQIATGYGTSWKRDEDRSHFLGTLLARGSVLAQQSRSSTVDWNPNSSTPAVEESSAMSQEKEQLGEREFQIAKALTEEQMSAIKSLRNHPDELEKQKNLIHICVCDRGGQELYLPIHTALIANCSEFIPKAYLMVFNLMKRLGDVAIPTFHAQQGMRKITYGPSRQLKNAEILGRWATAVDLAHPQSEMEMCRSEATERQQRPFLGQHHARRGPPMFIIGTHYDEIVKQGEEGQQLLREQEIAVEKMLSEHEYIKRVVPADTKSNKVIFKVDNTRSGTGRPDPMVNTLKKLIFDMAIAYKNDTSATPLPYVVLESGLLNISQPDGPSSPCDSERKIVAIKDIFQLAQRYCDIEDDNRCKTALRYLSSVGSIFYFFKATGLTDKVFTDPQWLFDVMSTFVTILRQSNISLQLRHDLKKLKEEGRLSRELAEHLLEKRPELGVKPKHYNTIFRLLQLVDVFCPALSHPKSSIEDAKMFYVPCMLAVDYKEETAWEKSDVANASQPPSLIFKASNVDSFPESLFFRLSSRTAYQFPKDPQLKRSRIRVLLTDCGLELELLYHPSCRYVIATTVPVCNEEPKPAIPQLVNKGCVYIRRFICWQLDDAKRNGMDGFQYEMYFQDGKKRGTMNVDEGSLFRLPNGDELAKVVTNPATMERLNTDSLLIKSYYCSTNTQYEMSHTRKKSAECAIADSQLTMVADIARDRWWQIGLSLGLTRAELSEYEETKSLHYRLFCILADWKRKVEDPTVEDIIVACEKAGVGGEVRRILQMGREQGEMLAAEHAIKFMETSAKTGQRVEGPNEAVAGSFGSLLCPPCTLL